MKIWLIILAFLALALPASAQTVTVTAQSGVSFPASPDQTTVVSGLSVLDHYDLNVIAQNPVGALGFTFGLGKPTPDTAGLITVKPIANFGALVNGTYTAFIVAVGPGGAANSPSSDPFVRVSAPGAPGKPTAVAK